MNFQPDPWQLKGNDIERIEQSKGLYNNPEKIFAPSFIVDTMLMERRLIFMF